MVFQIAVFLFFCSVLFVFWLRWRMQASKGRFALSVVSALLTCLLTGLSAMTTTLPASIVSTVSQALGLGPINNSVPSAFVLLLTIVAMVLIYRFGVSTIINWDAPVRVSDVDLAEKYLENNLAALTLEQLKLFIRGQKDRLASDTAANWKDKTSEPPKPVAVKDLLKDMLVSAFTEIRIGEDGWRDDGEYWTGEILGPHPSKNRSMVAFCCKMRPTQEELETRLYSLNKKFEFDKNTKFFAIYLSSSTDKTTNRPIHVSSTIVDVLSSREMILNGLDLRSYAQSLIDAFERTRVGGTETTLQQSYVELKAMRASTDTEAKDLSKQLYNWLTSDTGEQIALTGEYGQGKSTALLKFCYDWAKRFVDTGIVGERVPLLIELRGQSPSETDPLGFISPWCARYRLVPQQVLNLIRAGDAVVIFEGFDELRNAGRAFYRHQHFNALWRFAYPGTKLVFTGRPNFFLDQEEANRTLRSEEARKVGGDVFTSIWRLQKLDENQISTACRGYDQSVRDGIVSAAKENSDFLEIVSRPSMLPVVATIWSDIQNFNDAGAPLTGAALIEKYIQAVFSRKEAELERDRVRHDAPTGSRYLILPKSVRELLTVCVAWRMSGLKAKNTIARAEIVEMVRDLFDSLLSMSKSDGVSPNIAEGLIEFEKRYSEESPAERVEVIAAEICSAGLLVPDAAGGTTNLRFPHKQFFEFLIAKGIAIKTKTPSLFAAELLERSSSEARLGTRLKSEPNAILYLVEIIGPDIKRVFSVLQRAILRVGFVYVLSVLNCSKTLRHGLEKSPVRLQKKNVLFDMAATRIVGAEVEVDIVKKYASQQFIAGIIGGILASTIGIFLSSLLSLSLFETITIATGACVLTIGSLAALKTIPEVDQTFIAVQYLRAAWNKEGCFPKSRLHELKLASRSMASGRVEYSTHVEHVAISDTFLHPATEFGEIRRG